jgi:uncharacterized repeat protein (TIGR04076 family)
MPSRSRIQVIAVRGVCNAELRAGDMFLLDGFCITPRGHNKTCYVAFASLVANIGRLKLQEGSICVSCPDPGTGMGGNVLFELSSIESDENGHH